MARYEDMTVTKMRIGETDATNTPTPMKLIQSIAAALTPLSVAAATAVEQTFTVAGLKLGDIVTINPPVDTKAVLKGAARVSADNTLKIWFVNPTAGALVPDAGTYTVLVHRPA